MPIVPVVSVDDPRIAAYRNVRERDLVGRGNRFIAEGKVVLDVLLRSPFQVESLLVSEKQAAFADGIPEAIRQSVPVYLAPQPVMDAIAGFPIHRGVLAVGLRPLPPDPVALLHGCAGPVLGLVGIANHDNIGGLFRNAAAFGCDAVLLDAACCDPLYRKALRVSVGGVLKVPFARVPDAATMVEAFNVVGFECLALSPSGRENLSEAALSPRTALLLGAEGPGLPESILVKVRSVAIPMANGFDSLNVATTGGIALYELTSAARRRG